MALEIQQLELPGAAIVKTQSFSDERGCFGRLYCRQELAALSNKPICQVNFSRTSLRGTVRGLHFQRPPHAEMKMVRCLRGRVYDVIVDLRKGSPTLRQWHAEELTPDAFNMVVVPEGFAHGFQALEDNSELLYLHTDFYTPEAEDGIRYDCGDIGIRWPMEATCMSERDRSLPVLDESFEGIRV